MLSVIGRMHICNETLIKLEGVNWQGKKTGKTSKTSTKVINMKADTSFMNSLQPSNSKIIQES
ncbi:hypothetical protein KR52_03775 [Synechococcus sp. KORDI-52]|nr:hypothetical protein KR52_03775 [Synechococcus sp. KORDI-52]